MQHLASIGFAIAVSGLGGCAATVSRPVAKVDFAVQPDSAVAANWRAIVRPDDLARLDDLAATWRVALNEAARGHAKAIAAEGRLLVPDAALPRPLPTPGAYRCHTIRLGYTAATPPCATRRGAAFTRFKPFDCVISVEGDALGFTKVGGSNRPGGYLWVESERQMIFLGGTALRDREAASAYGSDPARDRIGVFERIGDFRWRLVLIGRGSEPRLEIIGLTPAVVPVAPPGG